MKNALFSYLALFLFIHAPIRPMEQDLIIFDALAQEAESGGITQAHKCNTPRPIIMEREISNQNDGKSIQQSTDIVKMFEEHCVPQEPTTPETSPSMPKKELSLPYELSQPGDSSDEEHNEPLSNPSHESTQAPLSDHAQSPNQHHNLPVHTIILRETASDNLRSEINNMLAYDVTPGQEDNLPVLRHTTRKILEIMLADATKQQEMVGGRSLAEIISPLQAESLNLHYERLATPEDLVVLFLSLKLKASMMPFEQRKGSIEFEHCKLIYAALLQKFKNNKKRVKELLCGTADYESDEETMIDEGLKPDGADVYRHSKNLLTFTKPKIEKAIFSTEATINSLTDEQNQLIEQIKKLKQQKKATNFKLTQEVAHIRQKRQALDILEQDRKEHKNYLDRRKKGLSETLESSKKSLTNISGDIEDAIIAQNSILQTKLKEQKEATKTTVTETKASLAKLEYDMKNFDSPSGYKLF